MLSWASRFLDRGGSGGVAGGRPTFWVGPLTSGEPNREVHIAFQAPDRAAVRAFFETAVATGATVLHEPRVRPEYHANYYSAFVRDPHYIGKHKTGGVDIWGIGFDTADKLGKQLGIDPASVKRARAALRFVLR